MHLEEYYFQIAILGDLKILERNALEIILKNNVKGVRFILIK